MKKNKLLDILICLANLIAIVQSMYLGHQLVALGVSLLFLSSQLLVYRENFLREQRTKKLLDILSRIETCSPEAESRPVFTDGVPPSGGELSKTEFEQFQTAMSLGTLTMAEFSQVLSRLTSTSVIAAPPLKQCQSCRFWHGKNNVVCAVHPSGYEGDVCTDFEPKP